MRHHDSAAEMGAFIQRLGVPIDQGQRQSPLIDADPGSAAGLAGVKREMPPRTRLARLLALPARFLLVTVHRQLEARLHRQKRNRAHQSASGYQALSAWYLRHSSRRSAMVAGRWPSARLAAPIANTRSHCLNKVA